MINKIAEFLEKYDIRNKTVIVGFSGGYDSMCLIDILNKLAPSYNINLIGAHYNHNWRGEIAKNEQNHCMEFCKNNGIEFYTETAPDNAKHNETVARELRYEFFERALEKYSADAIFTAHNFDDNAETVLYRIIKGTGTVGLKGILPNRGCYYRPLITSSRSDIEKYCEENHLCPNLDESNNDTVHKRNLIRHEILPLLREINPNVVQSLNSLAQVALYENEIIDEYMEKISQKLFDDNKIRTKEFIKLSFPLKQRIIYNLIYNSKYDYTRDTVLNICKFIEETIKNNSPSKFSIAKNVWIYADSNIIEIIEKTEKTEDSILIDKCGEYRLAGGLLRIEEADCYQKTEDETEAYIDLSNYKNLTLRTRNDGDYIQPLGFDGKMKLKKYLMSKKIPQHNRNNYLVLADKKEILWVAGIGLSDKIKVKDKPTHKVSVKYMN